MFCKFCGAEIDDDCVVCPACGKQVAPLKTEKIILELPMKVHSEKLLKVETN